MYFEDRPIAVTLNRLRKAMYRNCGILNGKRQSQGTLTTEEQKKLQKCDAIKINREAIRLREEKEIKI